MATKSKKTIKSKKSKKSSGPAKSTPKKTAPTAVSEEKISKPKEKPIKKEPTKEVKEESTEEVTEELMKESAETNRDLEYKVEIPQDARAIWAIQRFFLVSMALTIGKIYITTLSANISIQAIAIDAVLDLIVSGLGIYLIQWQQKILQTMHEGTQAIEINKHGAMAVAGIQGLIFFIGGIVVFFQGVITLQTLLFYVSIIPPEGPDQFPIAAALILAGIISVKAALFMQYHEDARVTENIAIKSLETNLKIDLTVSILAWFILIITAFWYWPWIVLDQIVAIVIGLWMMAHGLKFLMPLLRILFAYIATAELEEEGEENAPNNTGNDHVGNGTKTAVA